MREYYAASLSAFFDAVREIAEKEAEDNRNGVKQDRNTDGRDIPLLWYRGLTENSYTLLPTLYRSEPEFNKLLAYNQVRQKEDARYQHFKSRTYHLIKSNPDLENEWLEIYQHHRGKTRLLDWSESAKTALSFAVEDFLDTRNEEKQKGGRATSTPTVTVINPSRLNRKAYQYFYQHEEIIRDAVSELFPGDSVGCMAASQKMRDNMEQYENILFSAPEDIEMGGVLSLCVLEDMRDMAGSQFKQRITSMEFNPFHYLALRYYTDALPVLIESDTAPILPPLAILHPYHSERIRKQRGTFSIYPNYVLSKRMQELKEKRGIDARTMESQWDINSLLSRIYITNPAEVAKELLYAGERRTELYPGLDDHAWRLETQMYYV
ncbi:MAG: FRG domain-containing protein [Blautia sp.]|nr:FRG domain-containing protein [Blautia sp.]